MVDGIPDVQGLEAPASDTNQQETIPGQQATETPASSGGNPAWEPLRQKLDPITFKSIEDDLKNWDTAAQSKITQLNQSYAPFKALVDVGHTPQLLQQSLQIAQEIDRDPLAFHEKLTNFLQSTGRMPRTQQELAQVVKGDPPEGDEEQTLPDDPRIAQLQQQQERIDQFLAAQQQEQIVRQAEASLDQEIGALQTAHPEFSKEDIQEVIARTALLAQQNAARGDRTVPTLEEGAAVFLNLRNRILSTPRPGDSAPRLLPTSGGVPAAAGQQRKLGDLSSGETVDLLAGLIQQSQGK